MDGLNELQLTSTPNVSRYGRALGWFVRRSLRQFTRRWGTWGWMCTALGMLMLAVGAWGIQQRSAITELAPLLAALPDLAQDTTMTRASEKLPAAETARDRLAVFERHLLPHDEIPQAIQDLLRQAEDKGLQVERGDYKPQTEERGQFLRFSMSLPVTGEASSILEFTHSALLAQPSLALEGIRFKREGLAAGTIEARLNWVLFTQLPAGDRLDRTQSDRRSRL